MAGPQDKIGVLSCMGNPRLRFPIPWDIPTLEDTQDAATLYTHEQLIGTSQLCDPDRRTSFAIQESTQMEGSDWFIAHRADQRGERR